jgi:flagellar assembly protein FliH
MTIAHLLEDFGAVKAVEAVQSISEELLEEQRLASFEHGYSAGWEDAVSAHDSDTAKISSALANTIEDVSFTYREAQTQLIESLDPMFKVLTSAVLPDTLAASFGHHIVDQLTDMARGQTEQPIAVVVSPGESAAIRPLLPQGGIEVQLREDAGLAPGQVQLAVGDCEREINSSALIESIRDSVDAFSYQVKEEAQYG